jgi:hypothetical protein
MIPTNLNTMGGMGSIEACVRAGGAAALGKRAFMR